MIRLCNTKFKALASKICVYLPAPIKIAIYRTLFGYKIGTDVKIGRSLITGGSVAIGDHVRIGHRNKFVGTPIIQIGSYSTIGDDNTFTSTLEFTSPKSLVLRGNKPCLIIGSHCGIGYQHYFDIQDEFIIQDFSTIAGIRSVFFTHFLDIMNNKQSTRGIKIGKYCTIWSNSSFAPGTSLPNYCVVSMGAFVIGKHNQSYALLGGNPAQLIVKLSEKSEYFLREAGFVSSVIKPPFKE